MKRHVTYCLATSGKVLVRLKNGTLREATPTEWLEVWSSDPRLTLLLVR
jgi:hypothetical protein